MPLTPASLVRHELVGLSVRVVEADNPDLVGIEGRVVDETTNTLRVEGAARVRTVPKAGATFAFELPDGTRVRVEGDRLVARPARRTETTGGSQWQSA
ncbi:MAG: ribonuclease P protein component 1 [Halobacteriales archaeon]